MWQFLYMLRKTIGLEKPNSVAVFISNHPHKYSNLMCMFSMLYYCA